MRVAKNVIKHCLLSIISLLIFYFVFDKMADWMVSVFAGIKLNDWWDEFIIDKKIYHYLSTVVLSCLISLTWNMSVNYSKSLLGALVALVVGEFVLITSASWYWSFLESTCLRTGTISIWDAYELFFSSVAEAKKYTQAYLGIAFMIFFLLRRSELFAKKQINKTILHQIFLNKSSFDLLINLAFSFGLIIGRSYLVVGICDVPIPIIVAAVGVIGAVADGAVSTVLFIKLKKYYLRAMNSSAEDCYLVTIRDVDKFEYSTIFSDFLKNKNNMTALERGKIFILPEELVNSSQDIDIVVDVYQHFPFFYSKRKQRTRTAELCQGRGVINIVWCDFLTQEAKIPISYDRSVNDVHEAVAEIVRLTGYVEFRRKQKQLIVQLEPELCDDHNALTDEIRAFAAYLDRNINDFMVFDCCIKWLEICNYLYSLSAIARQELLVSKQSSLSLINADFTSWVGIRQTVAYNEQVHGIMNHTMKDTAVFERFEKVWFTVTTREYHFSKRSIEELLRAANSLRDYTRGHGVFTFEISQEMNLALIAIVVFLLKQLLSEKLLSQIVTPLKKMGWIVYMGDTPYFLYSYDPRNAEYRFDSFRTGSSMTLPTDIRGEG